MGKNIWKNLKKWLGMGVLAGGLMFPLTSRATPDIVYVYDKIDSKQPQVNLIHYAGSQEGSDGFDSTYGNPLLPPEGWVPKIVTAPYGTDLRTDCRPETSETPFFGKLMFRTDGGTTGGSNEWQFVFEPSAPYNGPDTNRHYWAKINVYSNYTASSQPFSCVTNVRDVVSGGGWVKGPQLANLSNNCTNGDFTVYCPFNRLVSSKTGNGTSSFEGNQIMPYNANTNVTLNANPDHYVKQYVLTRTDNIGNTTTTTNDVPGQTNQYTYVFDNIKGSNSIYTVYAEKTTTNGIPYGWFRNYGYTNQIIDSIETNNFDTDTMNNLEEYFADTNPTNEFSYFGIADLRQGSSLELEIPNSSTSRTYYVDSSTNLLEGETGWTKGITNSVGTGSNLTFHLDANGDDRKFYRARVGLN